MLYSFFCWLLYMPSGCFALARRRMLIRPITHRLSLHKNHGAAKVRAEWLFRTCGQFCPQARPTAYAYTSRVRNSLYVRTFAAPFRS